MLLVGCVPLSDSDIAALPGDADERMEAVLAKGVMLLGLLGLRDPPREGVKDSIELVKRAGLQVPKCLPKLNQS